MATDEDVRRIALSLPKTFEKPSYGTPGFRVRDKNTDKLFARLRDEPGVLVMWCEDEGEKQAMIDSRPAVFFTTPHYDGYPMVLVRLDAVDVAELSELLTESWRLRAPTKLLQAFDAERR